MEGDARPRPQDAAAVERDECGRVGPFGGEERREAADAKADDTDTALIDVRVGAEGRQAGRHVHRDAVVCQPGEMRHHLRHVGVAELHAVSGTVEQLRCERDVSMLGQPLADVLDVVIDAECFLNTSSAGRRRVPLGAAGTRASVRRRCRASVLCVP